MALPASPQPVRRESTPRDHLMPTFRFAHSEPGKVTLGATEAADLLPEGPQLPEAASLIQAGPTPGAQPRFVQGEGRVSGQLVLSPIRWAVTNILDITGLGIDYTNLPQSKESVLKKEHLVLTHTEAPEGLAPGPRQEPPLRALSRPRIAGVQCMTVPGYSKGFGYQPGQSFSGEFDHAWNAVFLEGRWHLVDSTWGSGLVDSTTSKFTFLYNEFYFLTHPALFIEDHFPDNKNWQLLKPPQSLRQFENNMYHKSEFYNKGMLSAHPQTSIIKTVNGKVTVTIESCAPTLFMFMLNGKQEHGLLSLRKNGMKLDVYPPTVGTHKLQIFAKGNSEIYSSVLEYTLKCHYADIDVRLPAELHQPVGPSWFSEQMGITKPSHPEPVIYTSDGRCSVSFSVEEGISVLASLHGDDGPVTEETQRRYIFQLQWEKRTELKVQVPHAGKFALKIFVKKSQEPGNYVFVFNYLLCCTNSKVNWPVFPESFGNWGQENELLEPLSGVLPANRNVPFKLKLHGVAKALVKGQDTWPLTLNREGYWEGNCSTAGCQEVYVMVLENANHNFYSYILKYKVNAQ
ncbi:hypothetical protein J1605_021169 [Eschrichtius robustus]|uniref:KY-like immunoglobulin-like domain-containing protein n=1 Tax=Eschrichtius robustus TaxID=9764 RepID=A0AB34HG88_ESCRO|nr:hypothetical protein J1605_021169 [Eschrichtius robustus]